MKLRSSIFFASFALWLSSGGCTLDCKSGTVLLTFEFNEDFSSATHLDIWTDAASVLETPIPAGQKLTSGSRFEVELPSYMSHANIDLNVLALKRDASGDQQLARGSQRTRLAADCSTTAITLVATQDVAIAQSKLEVSPKIVAADGKTFATVTLTVEDQAGSPVAGVPVKLTTSDISSNTFFSQTSPTSNVDGQVTALIASLASAPQTVTATFAGSTLETTVDFVPGSHLEITPTQLPADGNTSAGVKFTLVDGSDHPIVGKSVTFTSSGATDVITQPSAPTDGDGVVEGSIASQTVGAEIILAVVDGTVVAQAPISFSPAAPQISNVQITTTPHSTCVQLSFDLTQLQHSPVQISVDYRLQNSATFIEIPSLKTTETFTNGSVPGSAQTFTLQWDSEDTFLLAARMTLHLIGEVEGAQSFTDSGLILIDNTPSFVQMSSTGPSGLFVTGGQPNSIVALDFNGDHVLDLATSNYVDDSVSVLFGNGDGSFQSRIDYPLNLQPKAMISADFNGDHRPDLAVVGTGIGVLLASESGDGTFTVPPNIGSDTTSEIIAADYDGDQIVDLATFTIGVTLRIGVGDGSFRSPTESGAGFPHMVAAADFNLDGAMDLVTDFGVTFLGKIDATHPHGNGTFSEIGAFSDPLLIDGLTVGDFNHDLNPDIAAANSQGASVSVELGKGDGTFFPAGNFLVGISPSAIVSGDFNGDGFLDLAVADANQVSVIAGKGDGTFSPAASFGAVSSGNSQLVSADLDGDGRLDFAVTSGLDPKTGVTVLLNRSSAHCQ